MRPRLISSCPGTRWSQYPSQSDRLHSDHPPGRDQVHDIFLREVKIFPPPGLDADDNFFARRVLPARSARPAVCRRLRAGHARASRADPGVCRLYGGCPDLVRKIRPLLTPG